MERILSQASTNAPSTPAEEEAIGMKEERASVKEDSVEDKCKTLHHEIVESEDAHKVFHDGIHFTIEKSKDWKGKTDKIVGLQQTYLKESVGLENTTDKQVARDAMDNLTCVLNANIRNLDNDNEEFSSYPFST